MLKAEAAANDGHLAIDTEAHFVSGSFDPLGEGGDAFSLPEQIHTIEAGAFENSGVQILRVPESCTAIQTGAFKNCKQLRMVWLPGNCSVDSSAFDGCTALKAIYAPAGSQAASFAEAWGMGKE